MFTSSSDLPKESIQIMKDDKFFGRLLSRESSLAVVSSRVYDGVVPGAVPFEWESQPGTPKNNFSPTSLPPLTPPPSYLYSPKKNPIKKSPKFNLLHTIFPRFTMKKSHALPSSSLSLSYSASSSSSISSASKSSNQYTSPGSSFSSRDDSSRCSCSRRKLPNGLYGCNSVVIMKNALLTMVGHGSSQGTA